MKVHMVVHRGVPASSPHLPSELATAASTARAPVANMLDPASARARRVVVSNKRMNSSRVHQDRTGLEKPPPVVVERHVDVLDADVPSALSM